MNLDFEKQAQGTCGLLFKRLHCNVHSFEMIHEYQHNKIILNSFHLNCSLEVGKNSLIRSQGMWIEVHLKIKSICIFSCFWDQFQFPRLFIVLSNVFLRLNKRKQIAAYINFHISWKIILLYCHNLSSMVYIQ